MSQLDDLYAALKNADAAGDTAGARKLAAYIQTQGSSVAPSNPPAAPSYLDKVGANIKSTAGAVGDMAAGAVRGAGSIGATLLAPVDATARGLGVQNDFIGRTDRRSAMTAGLQDMGADPNSLAFKAGKLGGEVAGTAGAGGILAKGAQGLGAAPEVINALRTGGFATGPSRLTTAGNIAVRSGGGIASGSATVGLASPEDAGSGAVIGGALPGTLKLAGVAGAGLADAAQSGAQRLMRSALKPTIAQQKNGEAATAVEMMLKYGINATESGVNKLKGLISDLNDQIGTKIGESTATINPQKVVNALAGTKQKFGNQVAPTNDLSAIGNVESDFLANGGAGDIPVQLAQKLKQGTYATLKGKYGQMGSAETEANKGLARGLKEEIATAVPEVAPLNAEESKLLATLTVAERRALMDMNKNPMGLAALAHNPIGWAAFMADRSAAFKSLAARALNSASQSAPSLNALAGPAVYRSLPRAGQQN